MSAGRIVVVSAPSGAGKSTVVKALRGLLPDLAYSVSLTTRAPRSGEQDGVHYHFVTRDDFLARVRAGEMLEHAEVFGNLYGTSARVLEQSLALGRCILLEIDVQGAAQVKARFPQATLVFLLPPDAAELERRLRSRGSEDEATIQRRLAAAQGEISAAVHFDYLVLNDVVAEAAQEMAAIITAEGLKTARGWPRVRELWGLPA